MGLVFRLIELLLVLLPLIGVGYATFKGIVAARGRLDRPAPDAVEPRRGGVVASGPARGVARAMEQHDRTDTRWLDYELDVGKLLDFPMMTDVRDPLTQRFHRAKLRADMLRPARPGDLDGDRTATGDYLDAVGEYVTAFDVAEAEAVRRRRAAFSNAERDRLSRAQRLLRVAADDGATAQERDRAYRTAQRELDGLVVLPERTRAELERGITGELD